MIMQNEFDGRDEVVLIEYDGIIRNSDQYLLHRLGNDLYPLYKDFLNLEEVKGKNMESCLTLAHMMPKRNIFETFNKGDLPEDWYGNYLDLLHSFPDMYQECSPLNMYSSLYSMIPQKFLKKIIIWSRFEDLRIVEDIKMNYTDVTKIAFVNGPLKEVVEQQQDHITMFMLTDVYTVSDVIKTGKAEYSEFMIPKYRYNQTYNKEGLLESKLDIDALMELNVKVAEFVPATLTPFHFIELINK